MYFVNKLIGYILKLFNNYKNRDTDKLRLKYPNSKISTKVSITLDCKLGDHSIIHPNVNLSNTIIGNHTVIHSNVNISNAVIGDYTYVTSNINNSTIGKFCSIGAYCMIGLGTHPSKKFVSTFPAFYSIDSYTCNISFVEENLFEEFGRIEIGNDVWVGVNSIILNGVKIGDGAIIGAGAVVTKNVEDYAIVGGVPAKLIRYRFSNEQIDFLKKVKWWDKDINWIKSHHQLFQDIDVFVEHIEQ